MATPIEEALARLVAAAVPVGTEVIDARQAAGRVAAERVRAPSPVSSFSRAAMDGYVCHDDDVAAASADHPVELRITGAVAMGTSPGAGPGPGEAWAILTGAPLPDHGDRVLPVESVHVAGDVLRLARPPESKRHVAAPGEEIAQGAVLATAGEVISPASAASLVASGVGRVAVHRRLRVAVLATGDELIEAEQAAKNLPRGQTVNSNRVWVDGELAALGCETSYLGIVPDDPEILQRAFEAARGGGFDVVLSTGGVSVGTRDHVHRAWLNLGAARLVGRVDLKPGGPFFAGRLGATWVVGLSGTPVAALATYHLLVRPLLLRLAGRTAIVRPLRAVVLPTGWPRRNDAMRALWAQVDRKVADLPVATLQTGKPEGTMAATGRANALVLLPPGSPALAPFARATALFLDEPEDRGEFVIAPPQRGMTVIGIVGESGSGKTTVIGGLTRRLTAAGLRIAVVKHAAHGFAIDRPDADSARSFASGAEVVLLAGPDESAVRMRRTIPTAERAIDSVVRLLEEMGGPPDLILIEGFAHAGRPVIQVGRAPKGVMPLEVWATLPEVSSMSGAELEAELERLATGVLDRLDVATAKGSATTAAPVKRGG